MIVKKVEKSDVSVDDLTLYNARISKLRGYMFNAPSVGIDKRIITVRFGRDWVRTVIPYTDSEYLKEWDNPDELTFVNPVIVDSSKEYVAYLERDFDNPKKHRKTLRHTHIKIESDNMEPLEFSANLSEWNTAEEFRSDIGLAKCVLWQRLVDSINGIDITHPSRTYNPQVKSGKKVGRNDRVMLQSPSGETIFIKYKNAETYLNNGYNLI